MTELFGAAPAITVAALALAAFAAGYLDAVAGGGGLIQVPAMLIAYPHLPLAGVFGTNKISAMSGTAMAARTYRKRNALPAQGVLWLALAAGLGSALGAALVGLVNRARVEPFVFATLIGVGIFVVVRPNLGTVADREENRHRAIAIISAFGIGVYDGVLGPGTGTFLVIMLVGTLGLTFLRATATAKFVNVATNFAALAVFIPAGHIIWGTAMVMASANLVGGWAGAHSAVRRGSPFVRFVYLVVLAVLVIKFGLSIVS